MIKTLTVTAVGADDADLVIALEEVRRKVSQGFTSGHEVGEGRTFNYSVTSESPSLTDWRRTAADAAWEAHDIGDRTVAGQDGWRSTDPGDEWTLTFYLEEEEGDGPSRSSSSRNSFVVIFSPGTDKVEYAYVSGE